MEKVSSTKSVPGAKRVGTTAVHPLVEAFRQCLAVLHL